MNQTNQRNFLIGMLIIIVGVFFNSQLITTLGVVWLLVMFLEVVTLLAIVSFCISFLIVGLMVYGLIYFYCYIYDQIRDFMK